MSLSAHGNIGVLGAPFDDNAEGAAWIFICSSSTLATNTGKFKAFPSGDGVQTLWTAYDETNTNRYIVERSIDRRSFKDLGNKPAKGNSVATSYSWFDSLPLRGDNFYRLKIIDKTEERDTVL